MLPEKDLRELQERYKDILKNEKLAEEIEPPREISITEKIFSASKAFFEDTPETAISISERASKEGWYGKPLSSNFYFYGHILKCLFSQFIIFISFNVLYIQYWRNVPTFREIVNFSFWGMIIAFAFHIYRWIHYRDTPRRVKSAFPVMFFILTWFCAVLFFNGWNFRNTYVNLGIIFIYVFLISPLFIYWKWANNDDRLTSAVSVPGFIAKKIGSDDRLAMLWFLGVAWFLSACFVLPLPYNILVLLSALIAYGSMLYLHSRVEEGAYWQHKPGSEDYDRDGSGLICLFVEAAIIWVGLGAFIIVHTVYNHQFFAPEQPRLFRPFFTPYGAAFHFVISSFLSSEFFLYTLNKCGLLELNSKKKGE